MFKGSIDDQLDRLCNTPNVFCLRFDWINSLSRFRISHWWLVKRSIVQTAIPAIISLAKRLDVSKNDTGVSKSGVYEPFSFVYQTFSLIKNRHCHWNSYIIWESNSTGIESDLRIFVYCNTCCYIFVIHYTNWYYRTNNYFCNSFPSECKLFFAII